MGNGICSTTDHEKSEAIDFSGVTEDEGALILKMAREIAWRFSRRGLGHFDEIVSEACYRGLKAAELSRTRRPVSFKNFVGKCMWQNTHKALLESKKHYDRRRLYDDFERHVSSSRPPIPDDRSMDAFETTLLDEVPDLQREAIRTIAFSDLATRENGRNLGCDRRTVIRRAAAARPRVIANVIGFMVENKLQPFAGTFASN